MPLTRELTIEEDITMSITTVITGLMAKYNYNGRVDANAMFHSIVGNTALHINQMIEDANMTIIEKGTMRGDLKSLTNKAFRAKMTLVNATDEAPHQHVPADAAPSTPIPQEHPASSQEAPAVITPEEKLLRAILSPETTEY